MKVRLNREIGSRVVEALLLQDEKGKYTVSFNGIVLKGIKNLTHAEIEAEILMNDWLFRLDNAKKVA